MIKGTIVMLIAFGIFSIAVFAQAPNGVVYIESNIGHVSGQNSILAFRRVSGGGGQELA